MVKSKEKAALSEVLSHDVQLVLDHFGLEEKDFEKLDPYVNWVALARSIENPTKTAVCNILDAGGKIVVSNGRPVRVHVEVPVKDTLKILAQKSLRWLKWWD